MKIKRPKAAEQAAAEMVSRARSATDACEQERARLVTKLAQIEQNKFPVVLRALAQLWRSSSVVGPRKAKGIDDPVSGRIHLDEKLSTVLAHPLLQRLSRVKQLSFSYAQFPSARHSRLSHSLGVAKLAELALSGILDRGVYYVVGEARPREFEDEIIRKRSALIGRAKLVGLLHDVGHGPFGHALDNYAGILIGPKPDKRFTTTYVERFLAPTLRHLDFNPDDIIEILRPDRPGLQGFDQLIADIVDSSLDVDRMDYLVRDAHMTGLAMGFTNSMALIDCMRPVFDQGAYILTYDAEGMGYMEHLLTAREAMYLNCYEHPKKLAGERILTRLIQNILEDQSLGLSLDDIFSLTDEELTAVLRGVGCGSEFRQRLLEELLSDLDYTVVYEVPASQKTGGLPPVIKNWLDNVVKTSMGQPPQQKLAYMDAPENWEKGIAQNSVGIQRDYQIQVVVPGPDVYPQKQGATRLLKMEGGRCRVANFFDEARGLKELLDHLGYQRQKIRVMCPVYLSDEDRDRIKHAAVNLLGGQV